MVVTGEKDASAVQASTQYHWRNLHRRTMMLCAQPAEIFFSAETCYTHVNHHSVNVVPGARCATESVAEPVPQWPNTAMPAAAMTTGRNQQP